MNKFITVYNIMLFVWHAVSEYKDRDISDDAVCEEMVRELNGICRACPEEHEKSLVRTIATAIMEYIYEK